MSSASVTSEKIIQLGLGFMGSKVLLSATELDLFTVLATEPLNCESLARKLGLHERGARDFFDALVALGMLERSDGLYRNTPESDRFLDRAKPSYVGGIIQMANARLYPFWGRLTDALKSGEPQNEVRDGGQHFFELLYSDPARLSQFLGSMTGLSMGAADMIAAKFPWAGFNTFIDVGCAQGGVPVQIALAHPHLMGKGYDLAVVQPHFEKYVRSFNLQNRLSFQAGDFIKEALPEADVLVMGHILHDWNLNQKKMLLRKAYQSLPPGGAVILYESIIDDDRSKNAAGLLMSLNMLIETPGGFDYSARDCFEWLLEAGFRETRVEHLCGPDSMVIGIK